MTVRRTILSALAAVAVAAAAAGCGGGGGGPEPLPDPAPPGPAPPNPLQLEYDRQGGLHLIKAHAMHQRGGTGKGITIALFDTGSSDHPEVSGKYVYESKVDIDCNPKPPGEPCVPQVIDVGDDHGHGTFIAGLMVAARNGEGILGVAYEAELASVAINADELTEGQYPSWLEELGPQITEMAAQGAFITNNSWGTSTKIAVPGPSMTPATFRELMPIDAYQAYVDAGGVQVWAIGNEQAAFPLVEAAAPWRFPDLEKGWLAVGAVGLDGTTSAWYSNWCGLVADWCVVAPAGGWRGPSWQPTL